MVTGRGHGPSPKSFLLFSHCLRFAKNHQKVNRIFLLSFRTIGKNFFVFALFAVESRSYVAVHSLAFTSLAHHIIAAFFLVIAYIAFFNTFWWLKLISLTSLLFVFALFAVKSRSYITVHSLAFTSHALHIIATLLLFIAFIAFFNTFWWWQFFSLASPLFVFALFAVKSYS